eukprot:TRINITY_DN3019_c0_g1_i4.p1 TRINITY_DN3019_c0_g1~~TRINITY_DN3019_c0_g1_i4.p1  ORF type:complete len:244 (-),score=65.54 TRINITY_DN3019_c0_g1_i4:340-1023(-)
MCIRDRMSTEAPIVLVYWPVRARGEHLKLLLEYLGLPYTTKYYQNGAWEAWMADKAKLNCDYPNVPHIIDGDKVISETDAIAHYLCLKARRPELLGRTPDQKVFVRTLRAVIVDLLEAIMTYHRSGKANVQELSVSVVLPRLERISRQLGNDLWLAGDITYVDFLFGELLQMIGAYAYPALQKCPNLMAYSYNFESLPQVAAYRASPRNDLRRFFPPNPAEKVTRVR